MFIVNSQIQPNLLLLLPTCTLASRAASAPCRRTEKGVSLVWKRDAPSEFVAFGRIRTSWLEELLLQFPISSSDLCCRNMAHVCQFITPTSHLAFPDRS